MDNLHYMYVLKCSDDSLYTGYATDVARRVKEHNSSELGAKYTRGRRPVSLLAYASFQTRKQATKAEYHFKLLPRQKKIDLINSSRGDSHEFARLLSNIFSID